ncbi:unnamed protein product, partial [Rotaria sordida]
MTNLKIFDIHHTESVQYHNYVNNNQISYHHLIHKFISSFWIERK